MTQQFNVNQFFTEGIDGKYNLSNALSLFNFYENNKSLIYSLIAQNKVINTDSGRINKTYYDIFNEKYNRKQICLKLDQQIICDVANSDPIQNNKIKSYIFDCKRSWQGKTFYSKKYNRFYKYDASSPYSKLDDNTFLLLTNGIHSYFFDKNVNNPAIEVNKEEEEEQVNVDETDCGCSQETSLCDNFYKLQVSPVYQQALHNILYMNGNIKSYSYGPFMDMLYGSNMEDYSQISNNIKNLLGIDIDEEIMLTYFPSVDEHYYFDDITKNYVVMNKLYIAFTYDYERLYIPLYKVITIFPYDKKQHFYINFFLDNDPPQSQIPMDSINNNYYTFLMERITFFIQLYKDDKSLFKDGYYVGDDYLDYQQTQIDEFEQRGYDSQKSEEKDKLVYLTPQSIDEGKLYNLGGKRTRRFKRIEKANKRSKTNKRSNHKRSKTKRTRKHKQRKNRKTRNNKH